MANWKQVGEVLRREFKKLSNSTLRLYPDTRTSWQRVYRTLKNFESAAKNAHGLQGQMFDIDEYLLEMVDDLIEIEDVFADAKDGDNRRRAQELVKMVHFYAKG